jgi:hypothetical protein
MQSNGRVARTIVVLGLVGVVDVTFAWSGPYLFRTIEMSNATSQKECEGLIVRVLGGMQKERRLTVDANNRRLGVTRASTLHVDCIFVGPNERKQNQWIYYVAIASTNRQESQDLLKLIRRRFSEIVRID